MTEEFLLSLRRQAADLPDEPGVYIMKDKNGAILYVGKSRRLRYRVGSYFVGTHTLKTERMLNRVAAFDTILCHTEMEALSLENILIKKHAPPYNIRLKDAKSYPYIKITKEAYPRLVVTRERKEDGSYFGPYTGMSDAYAAAEAVSRVFHLPTCRRNFPKDTGRGRPCLYADLGHCMALCRSLPPAEEYAAIMRDVRRVLDGHIGATVSAIEEKMRIAAEEERFEEAARLRNSAAALRKLRGKQRVVSSPSVSLDAVALHTGDTASVLSLLSVREGMLSSKRDFLFSADALTDPGTLFTFLGEIYETGCIPRLLLLDFPAENDEITEFADSLAASAGHRVEIVIPKRGEKKKICEMAAANARHRYERHRAEEERDEKNCVRLASLLGLEVVPERIEAYDISEWGNEYITASMVVARSGRMRPSEYCLFRIRTTDGMDDYAAMRAAIARRAVHIGTDSRSLGDAPDLILTDGGRGQVHVAMEALSQAGLDIPVFGMVKDDYHKTRALTGKEGEISIAQDRGLYSFIYKIQEEAHRFAVKSVQAAKRKSLRHSELEEIPGIGPKKAKLLLSHFGSLAKIRELSRDELHALPGISVADAESIRRYFTKKKEKKT